MHTLLTTAVQRRLSKTLVVNDDLLLISKNNGFITDSDVDEIKRKCGKEAKAIEYLDIIVRKVSLSNASRFLSVLKETCHDAAVQLLEKQSKHRRRISVSTPTTNKSFRGRGPELEILDGFISDICRRNQDKSIAVISGLGGIGKTELLLQLIQKVKNGACSMSTNAVITAWLDGSTDDSFKASIQTLTKCYESLSSQQEDYCQQLFSHLEDRKEEMDEEQLLILVCIDNLSNEMEEFANTLVETLLCDILAPLAVIVTCRDANIFSLGNVLIPLHGLEVEPSVELVTKLLQPQITQESEAKKLVEYVDQIPLLIHLSCAYINRKRKLGTKGERYSIQDYIRTIEKDNQILAKMNSPGTGNKCFGQVLFSTIDSILDTDTDDKRQLILGQLQLLVLISKGLVRQDIVIELLTLVSNEGIRQSKEQVECFLETLISYSIVQRVPVTCSLSMHSRVRAWLAQFLFNGTFCEQSQAQMNFAAFCENFRKFTTEEGEGEKDFWSVVVFQIHLGNLVDGLKSVKGVNFEEEVKFLQGVIAGGKRIRFVPLSEWQRRWQSILILRKDCSESRA